jgi:hypothetical protein
MYNFTHLTVTRQSQWPHGKTYVYGHSPAAIVGSNPTGGMDVCPLRLLSGCKSFSHLKYFRDQHNFVSWTTYCPRNLD